MLTTALDNKCFNIIVLLPVESGLARGSPLVDSIIGGTGTVGSTVCISNVRMQSFILVNGVAILDSFSLSHFNRRRGFQQQTAAGRGAAHTAIAPLRRMK